MAFADFDDDGWTDVFIANDNSEQQLFRNLGNGKFEDSALAAGVAFDDKGKYFSGMGIDAADYDADGRQDVFITALSNETYPLYRNTGDLLFDYVTQSSGVAQITILGAGWGVKWIDANNDGDTDIIISQINGAPVVLRNNGTKNHWIGIDMRGERSAANGEGARVIVTEANGRKQFFDASNAGSYLAANDPGILVGLGNATSVKQIEIHWTSGKTQTLESPAVDRYHSVNEK